MSDEMYGLRIWTEVVNEHVAVVRSEYAEQSFRSALDGYEYFLIPLGNETEEQHEMLMDQLHYEIGKKGSSGA